MHLYFHTNTEMALYYTRALLRDGDEHPILEAHDYVMENCKGRAVMGEPIRATVIPSTLWRPANTDGDGYCRLRRGVHQMGDPEKTMKETPSLYERTVRIVGRAEWELAGSFYVNLGQGMDLKTSIEAQKAGRGAPDKLGQIKVELAAMQQEFANKKRYGQDQTSGMPMELQEVEDVYLPGMLESKDCHAAVAVSGSGRDWGRNFISCTCGGPDWGGYPDVYHGCPCPFNHPF